MLLSIILHSKHISVAPNALFKWNISQITMAWWCTLMLCSTIALILHFHMFVCEDSAPSNTVSSHGSSDHHIDWADNHGCPARLTVRQNAQGTHIISTYIQFITSKYIQKCQAITASLGHSFKGVGMQYSCYDTEEHHVLTSVCHSMYFHHYKLF